jgi:hypothetical protein
VGILTLALQTSNLPSPAKIKQLDLKIILEKKDRHVDNQSPTLFEISMKLLPWLTLAGALYLVRYKAENKGQEWENCMNKIIAMTIGWCIADMISASLNNKQVITTLETIAKNLVYFLPESIVPPYSSHHSNQTTELFEDLAQVAETKSQTAEIF